MQTPAHKPLMSLHLEIATETKGIQSMPPTPPLGITCVAAWTEGTAEPVLWWAGQADGTHTPRMSHIEARSVLQHIAATSLTHRIVTWNGAGFDLPVLGAEAYDIPSASAIALNHIDMMLHILALKGCPIGLNAVAKGMDFSGKSDDTQGADAPRLWAEGHFDQVIQYCAQDARTTLDIALAGEDQELLKWQSLSGHWHNLDMTGGWLPVQNALLLLLPDTPWIKDPVTRESPTSWIST